LISIFFLNFIKSRLTLVLIKILMEFSEAFELKRIAKSRIITGESSPITKLFNTRSSIPTSDSTPTSRITNQSSPPDFYAPEPIIINPSNLAKISGFHIEKDTSYLQEAKQAKRSSLTMSLIDSSVDTEKNSPIKQLTLDIYFFRTPDKIRLKVPYEIKVGDMLAKALLAYSKSKFPMLPHGLNIEGYEVWLPEDNYNLPDTDYAINPGCFVHSLGVKVLCVCEKPGFRSSIYTSSKVSSILNNQTRGGLAHVKFFFENSSVVIAVRPNTLLREILVTLWKKFFIFGELSVEMFEFRLLIEEGGYECALDMGLKIGELPSKSIRLYRKVLADTPKALTRKTHKSQVFTFRELPGNNALG
jgi:hypothetical protein